MPTVGQPESATQSRVTNLFRDELGYRYLGDWSDLEGNSNIEEGLLSTWLTKSGYTPAQISVALHKLRTEADNHSRTLYGDNQAVYSLLRYGADVKIEAGKVTETVHLINWTASTPTSKPTSRGRFRLSITWTGRATTCGASVTCSGSSSAIRLQQSS